MTRAEIIAELRRSATEDGDPWAGLDVLAFRALTTIWLNAGELMFRLGYVSQCTFFLLVAHAMEDEK